MRPTLRSGQYAAQARPTLHEVARLARVSPATVSRVLNTPQIVAAETLERVQDAIKQTGYVPNLMAGGLASNRSRLVAAIVPNIARSIFNETVESMTVALAEANYQVMLSLSGGGDERMESVVDAILARRPEAIIVTGNLREGELKRRIVGTGATVIETWDLPTEPIDVAVGFSHEAVGKAVAETLYAAGRRRPLVLSTNTPRALARERGFRVAMEKQGVATASAATFPVPTSLAQGRAAFAAACVKGTPPDCVFCSSDWQAHGVLIEAQNRGLKTPEDVAVFGFGDLEFADATEPALSTVRINGAEIGRIAAKILIDRAAGREPERKVFDVGFELVRRGSA